MLAEDGVAACACARARARAVRHAAPDSAPTHPSPLPPPASPPGSCPPGRGSPWSNKGAFVYVVCRYYPNGNVFNGERSVKCACAASAAGASAASAPRPRQPSPPPNAHIRARACPSVPAQRTLARTPTLTIAATSCRPPSRAEAHRDDAPRSLGAMGAMPPAPASSLHPPAQRYVSTISAPLSSCPAPPVKLQVSPVG